MSWFTMAEDLLNRMDKGAATALKTPKEKNRELKSFHESETIIPPVNRHNIPDDPKINRQISGSLTYPGNRSMTSKSSPKDSKPLQTTISTKKINASQDEKLLFEFLNEPTQNLPEQVKNKEKLQTTLLECEPDSFIQNVNAEKQIPEILEEALLLPSSQDTPIEKQEKHPEAQINVLPPPIKEISTKNTSLEDFQVKIKDAEGETKRLKRQLDHWTSQITASEGIIRELRSRESDLQAALDAKDSQLAILRVRLQEADQEKENSTQLAQKLNSENERLLGEHGNINGLHNQNLENMQTKLRESKEICRQETERRKKIEADLFHLEDENRILKENLGSNEKKLTDLKSQVKDLNQQLKNSRTALDIARNDLSEYREKAHRILQSKEKLITTLRESNQISTTELETSVSSSELEEEVEKGREQLTVALNEDLKQARNAYETLQASMKEIEHGLRREADIQRERLLETEERLREEVQHREDLEGQLLQQGQELSYLTEDLARAKTNLQSRLETHNQEVDRLRKQLRTKALGTSSQTELESRIRNLTENLIQKQTLIETLSTEKSSLVKQLERTEDKLKDQRLSEPRLPTHIIGISEMHQSPFFSETPFDSNVTRKVKRAYGNLDSFSIRMGTFLRRYPASRAFLLAYVLLLHLWVIFVLLTYQPELHNSKRNQPL